ncbi:uncharacterized protein LOC62_01G001516 [Vanrija pseudolonga]|uniref:F-box domain-containing protein n=1 Tax=Vanrija pseudolonga TaxID=143232 RepID=A0AAF0Y702_9TREE|nr:hypothetical protein LOC62_01G001516 [Vanrija pseudolonga]
MLADNPQPQPPFPPIQPPVEVVSEIMSHVDRDDFISCLRVNSTFFHAVIPRLYSHIHLNGCFPVILSPRISYPKEDKSDPKGGKEDKEGEDVASAEEPICAITFENPCVTSKTGDIGRPVMRYEYLKKYTKFLNIDHHPIERCASDKLLGELREKGIFALRMPHIRGLETLRITLYSSYWWGGNGKIRLHDDVHGHNITSNCLFIHELRPKTLVIRGATLQHWPLFPVFDGPLSAAKRIILMFVTSEMGKDWELFGCLKLPPTLENLTIVYCTGEAERLLGCLTLRANGHPLPSHHIVIPKLAKDAAKHMVANPNLPFSITQVVFNTTDADKDGMRAAISRNPEAAAPSSASDSPDSAAPRTSEEAFQSLLAEISPLDLALVGSTATHVRDRPNPLRALTGEEFLARDDWQLAFRYHELFPKPTDIDLPDWFPKWTDEELAEMRARSQAESIERGKKTRAENLAKKKAAEAEAVQKASSSSINSKSSNPTTTSNKNSKPTTSSSKISKPTASSNKSSKATMSSSKSSKSTASKSKTNSRPSTK